MSEEWDPGQEEESHPEPKSSEELALPSEVLVEALARDRRAMSLDASGVLAPLMGEVIGLALGWLESHGRTCRNPMQCAETPGPLRRLLKVRRAVRDEQRQTVYAALWRYPESAMVREIRAEVRARHEELVEAVESGQLYERDELRRRLDGLERTTARDLAAVLWAAEADDPRTRELLSLLPALLPAVDDPPGRSVTADPSIRGKTSEEKAPHRAKRLELQRRVDELESELGHARGEIRTRAEDLSRAKRSLEDRTSASERLQERITALEDGAEVASERLSAAEARRRDAERSWKRASASSEAYRADLERVQTDLTKTDAERSALVRNLAASHARVQQLEAELRAIPRDKEAVADWLRREEDRLNEVLYTLEGGARDRALEEKRLRRKLEHAFLDAYTEFKEPPPVAVGGTRSLGFRALGGGDEVGRSAYEITVGPHTILVDCGISVGARHPDEQTPDISKLHRLDALLVTHAHTDHIGWIPALVAHVEEPFPIYCTRPTSELLPVMLKDSRSHYERALAAEQLKQRYNPSARAPVEAYTRDDIFEAENRLLEARVGEAVGIGTTDLRATFFPAGHILGAASVVLDGGGRRVVISGDISSDYQHTVSAFSVPDGLSNVDLLVLESTYGDRRRGPPIVAESELVEFVAGTVRDGIAVLPCFALGRAQEVLAILRSARRAGRLPGELRILVDGMINKINPVYIEQGKLDAGDFTAVGSSLDRELAIRDATGPDATPTVVVTTSGMLTGGPVIEWARRLLHDPRHRMALLGYQDEGAPGGLLRKLGRERPPHTVTLYDDRGEPVEVTVASEVVEIGLSAHADQDGLVAYAAAIRARRIVLVHGDNNARSALRDRLIHEGVCSDVVLEQEVHNS